MAYSKLLLLALMLAFLAACAGTPPPPAAPAPTASTVPTMTAAPTSTVTAIPTDTPTTTPEPLQPTSIPTETRLGIAPVSKMAPSISGKLYTYLTANSIGVRGFAFTFAGDRATVKLYFMLFAQELAIGLDDTYRYATLYGPGIRANIGLKGAWVSEDTFRLSMSLNNAPSESRLVFRGEAVDITTRDSTGERMDRAQLHLTFPLATAATIQVGQHSHSAQIASYSSGVTRTLQMNYLLYLPAEYRKNAGQKWPLILYLHGMGERGIDPTDLKKHPLPRILEQRNDFPFIVVSPQLTLETDRWADRVDALDGLVGQIESMLSIDSHRLYLTGISMGGFGTWALASRFPNRFAALVPIAGGYDYAGPSTLPANLCALKNTPVWVFHGDSDTSVPIAFSRSIVNALTACGSRVKFTVYSNTEHEESFYRAYSEPDLFSWLSAQVRQ